MKLLGLSEVMIICMGSSFSFMRIGQSSTWTHSISGKIYSSADVVDQVSLYEEGGKSLIIPVKAEDGAKPFFSVVAGPDVYVQQAFETINTYNKVQESLAEGFRLPDSCVEVQLFKTYDGTEVSGGTFWVNPFAEGKKWRRMELTSFNTWFCAGNWSKDQLESLIARERAHGWGAKLFDKNGTRIDIING